MTHFEAYTDGSCIGNPGPGGIGIVLYRMKDGRRQRKRFSIGYKHTTNNQTEMLAALFPFTVLPENVLVTVYTDSQYTINAVTKWAIGWKKRGWRKPDGAIKNLELVKALHELFLQKRVVFQKVKGHSGIEGNELADQLARQGSADPTEHMDVMKYIKMVPNIII